VPPSIAEEELQAHALATDVVLKALDGREPLKVIVRAPKLVNVVLPADVS
jgi:leucyl-tRNA synthetase